MKHIINSYEWKKVEVKSKELTLPDEMFCFQYFNFRNVYFVNPRYNVRAEAGKLVKTIDGYDIVNVNSDSNEINYKVLRLDDFEILDRMNREDRIKNYHNSIVYVFEYITHSDFGSDNCDYNNFFGVFEDVTQKLKSKLPTYSKCYECTKFHLDHTVGIFFCSLKPDLEIFDGAKLFGRPKGCPYNEKYPLPQ